MEKSHALTRLWRLIKTERSDIRNIYIFSIFQGLVGLSLPLGIQAIINLLQAGQLRSSWVVLVIFVLLGILFYGMLQVRQMTLTETIEQRLFVKSSFDLAYRLPRVSTEALHGKYVPEMMNRFFEIMTIQKGLSKLLIDFSAAVVQIIFGLLLLSFYHPLFILLGIVLVLLLTLIFWFTGPIGLKSSLEESSFKFKVAHWLEEVSRTVLTFKLSGNSELPLRKTDEFTSGYLDARQSHFRVLLTQYKVMVLFKLVVAAALIIAGSILVVEGKINIGQFVAAEIIIILVINSVEKIILNMSTVYDVLTALEKVGNLMDLSLERQDGNDLVQTGPYAGFKIEMKSLSFRLEDQKNNLLNNIDFSLQPGERLFVSGENGRGKTTLLKLIAGFYEHYEGSILINDIPLSNLKLSSVRSVIGENFTEQEIFRGSVLDNILCGKPGYSIDDAIQAAKLSGIQEYISNLKDGYATLLEPEGKQLSSGIIRKIVLARCLVTKPGILLLEDNLSSLPGKEKSQLINDIFQSCKGMTIVVVSNDETIGALCTKRLAL